MSSTTKPSVRLSSTWLAATKPAGVVVQARLGALGDSVQARWRKFMTRFWSLRAGSPHLPRCRGSRAPSAIAPRGPAHARRSRLVAAPALDTLAGAHGCLEHPFVHASIGGDAKARPSMALNDELVQIVALLGGQTAEA